MNLLPQPSVESLSDVMSLVHHSQLPGVVIFHQGKSFFQPYHIISNRFSSKLKNTQKLFHQLIKGKYNTISKFQTRQDFI